MLCALVVIISADSIRFIDEIIHELIPENKKETFAILRQI